ncbi:pleckstrin homology domain-containing family G member 1 isoform X2 [Sinocyclocheilus anshuiensis]|uniref:pleckstrin homology domain-containing family G member 1 isoform X2 n=1 Tax=Sinocyclocheilus anshuiensis TaxID=1608454 RepID=UPI0007BA4549|nr:PREDICTED: pleckstrin homology domain-containing family G member 1-like isoform X2 [Sinocyclocheilus anshuiensis]
MPTDYPFSTDVLPPLPEVPAGGPVLSQAGGPIRNSALRYCSSRSMDSTHCNERPVSYGSTSSSASSRDSHCSLGGRPVLGSAPERDHDSGAIRLELVPAQQLEEEETGRQTPTPTNQSHADIQSPEGRKVQYVDRVVEEILETEKTYVQDLRSIVQDYLESISNQSLLLLGDEERNSLFGNIREIYRFNSDLLHDLEKCNANPVAIAKCFVAKSEDFHIYTQYCTNYPRSVAVLTECMRNKTVAKFLRERQESLKHSLPLGSYLLKPVQRILKYHLLLHEIATHLEKDSEMYDVIQEAIDTMQRVAWHINDMKRKHEHAVRLQEIQSLLTNWKGPDLIGYGELVLEGTFRIQRAKNERTLFLFDKLLLITKKREETYTYKAHILCCNLMLVEVIPKEPLSFSVFHYKNPKLQHTVQAKSQQDKRMWVLHLKRLILENHPAKIPAKAKQAILEMDTANHPSFNYNSDDKRVNTKEGPSPRRVRRKTEPLSKLLKNSKHIISSPDIQKCSSLGVTLLSPVAHLGTIGRSRSLVSESQESLDPGDHSDVDDEPHPQDADDEDDTGLSSEGKLRVPGKGSRKRLNQQVSVDSIDQWRNHNLTHADLQTAKESLQNKVITPPILRVTAPPEGDRDERYSNMLGTGEEPSFRNIWTDHRVRRAMFPTRQKSFQIDDDEDIYQMFLPTENDMSSHDAESDHETADHPERPCSWHVEQTKPSRLDLPTSRSRILRRASSVGENQSEQQSPTKRALQDEEANNQTESSSNEISGSSSAEQLTIDDIENVYDNISYEELQAMGLIRKDQVNHVDSEVAEVKSRIAPQVIITPTETESSCESNRSSGQGGEPLETCELQIVEDEENVYDTIVFQEPPVLAAEMDQGKPESLKTSEVDIMASQILGGFVSEEKLCPTNKTEDEQPRIPSAAVSDTESSQISTADHTLEQVNEIWTDLENYIRNNEKKPDRLPAAFPVSRTDAACKTQDSPKKVHDTPHKAQDSLQKTHNSPSKGNRLQQRASDSKCKAQESPSKKANSAQNTNDSLCKLPLKMAPVVCAASGSPNPPASNPSPALQIPILNIPEIVETRLDEKDEASFPAAPSLPLPPTPEPQPGTVKSIRKKLARLSSGSFRMDDEDIPSPKDSEFQTLFSSMDSGSSSMLLSVEAGDQFLELGERGKNRVFLMARQYSQKIKKTNQLLKMKSMDHESSCAKLRLSKQKDLAAILEEKKQGGAAIGARIAEYSHLYEQVVFKGSPSTTPMLKSSISIAGPHPLFPSTTSSPSLSESSTQESDWLNCTYSNGELADYVSWPAETTVCTSTPQRGLAPASSTPALKNLPPTPSTPPNQRWSACVTPIKDDSDHIYTSIGPRNAKVSPHNRCQSSSSLIDQTRIENGRGPSNQVWEVKGHESRTHMPRQRSLPDCPVQGTSDLSAPCDITLRDSQQILVLNKNVPLNAQSATENYLANFKDTGDDDDDYVEIRSEDEGEEQKQETAQPHSLTGTTVKYCNPPQSSMQTLIKGQQVSTNPEMALQGYLWNDPDSSQQGVNQPTIVQSLREKFQCLSSSSFA